MTGHLVVLGDSMLDLDIDGHASRLSPEAPVPVVDAERMRQRPGGAGLAAVLAARTDPGVILVTALADDPHGRALARLLQDAGVRVVGLPLSGGTVCKTRIRARGQSVLRLDQGDGTAAAEPLPDGLPDLLADARAVCVADYGNGVSAHPGLRAALTRVAGTVPVVWDPHPRGAEPIPRVALVTPNEIEAQHFCGYPPRAHSAEALRERWAADAVCITLGGRGALLATRWGGTRHIAVPPGLTASVDTCGAGDRFAVAAAAALGSGSDAHSAVAAAVQAASRSVAAGAAGSVSSGTGSVSVTMGFGAEEGAVGTDIDAIARRLRRRGGRMVATGGCFDLLHTGHVRLLRQARDLGDMLVVLVNSDASVTALKGPGRPVMAAADRARLLAALECVDAVCIFDEPSPEAVLDRLRPDVWVKGGDYRPGDLPEAEVVTHHGGEVVIVPTVPGYSSSNLIATARQAVSRKGTL